MHIDKRLLKYARKNGFAFSMSVISGLLVALFTIVQAYYLSYTINEIFLNHSSLSGVKNFLLIFLLASFLKSLSIWFEQNFANKIAVNVKKILREKLSEHLFKVGPTYIKSEKSGELSNTILNGVEKLDAYFSKFLPQLFTAALIPLLILLFVFPIDLLSGIVFMVTAPLIPIFMILIGKLAETLNRKQWKTLNLMSGYFLDVIQGLGTIKLFGRESDIRKKIEIISNLFRISTMKVLRIAFLSALVLEILSTISIAIIAVEIGLRLLYGNLDFQPALFILILAPEFYLPIRQLGAKYHAGMEGIAAAESIFKILQTTPALRSTVSVINDIDFAHLPIAFNSVSFTYDNSRQALKNISFEIQPGSFIALVGKSGSGKTTVTNLLLRFIEPTEGNIYLGKFDFTEIDINLWRANVSWISQNPYLFHKTIKENILIAKTDATDDEIIYATTAAGIHEFIEALPKGYDTPVGERGTRLSGGQAQRIALARAFLKDSPILVMDEPTANLDPKTESELMQRIEILTKNKTVIMIAHRLNTIKKADRIFVFSEGRLIESGTHKSLLTKNGYYSSLIKNYTGYDEQNIF